MSCFGNANGSITTAAVGGTGPYTYLWNTGATTADLTGLVAGSYSVQITDATNCLYSQFASVASANTAINISTSTTLAACGGSNGTASASISGGSAPYTYSWDTDRPWDNSGAIDSLPAGVYNVFITDNAGCTSSAQINVQTPTGATINVVSKIDVSCNGGTNGSISLQASGTIGIYIYNWNDILGNIKNRTNMAAGTYTVKVIDGNQCQSLQTFTISQPVSLAAAFTIVNATCNKNNGSATANVSGGTSPFTYSWNNSSAATALTNQAAGAISVTVTDSKGCSASASSSIANEVVAQSICLVTVEPTTKHPIIVWQKTPDRSTASYKIYRESNVANVYTYIATVLYDNLSEYEDNVDASARAYRYKISTMDSCGNESSLSTHHKTMLIAYNAGSTPGTINIDFSEKYEGYAYGSFIIYKANSNNPNDLVAYDTIPSNLNLYVDDNPGGSATDTIAYAVGIANISGGGCTSTRAKNYNLSKSNTASLRVSSSSAACFGSSDFSVSPSNVLVEGDTATFTITNYDAASYTYSWYLGTAYQGNFETFSGPVNLASNGTVVSLVAIRNNDKCVDSSATSLTVEPLSISKREVRQAVNIYPNPYVGSTNINYSVTKRTNVLIEVYDILGAKVATLVNENKNEGSYRIAFGAKQRDLSEGVYLVKVTTDNTSKTYRIVEQ